MPTLSLVQLPVPPPAAFAATGNVPLAAGTLGVAARQAGLTDTLTVNVVPPEVTDALGDTALADRLAQDAPEFLGLSLYLWNVERSLHLAREVKRRSPGTRILVGGPEVNSDNPFVLQQHGFDIAVAGEAEDLFVSLMRKLMAGESVAGLPGVAVRGPSGHLGPFGPPSSANFPLDRYPSPYVEGVLPVDRSRSTYVETVRGCRSHCTFCFYPRSSNSLRILEVDASARLVAELKRRGAREVVFLDPTFNHRPGFVELVDALAEVNGDGALTFFAEVRAEGLTSEHATRLKRAGFNRLELGLQSVNVETLKRVKRGGHPDKVAAAADLLHHQGISLLVDLIVGLPGDRPEDISRGVDYLMAHGLADEAQVFPLSLLPGTAMRAEAGRDGITFDPAPPYRVQDTGTMREAEWIQAIKEAEIKLGGRLDEVPRHHLVADAATGAAPDVVRVNLDRDSAPNAVPGAPHLALWLEARDLGRCGDAIRRVVAARLERDPFATLDVILSSRNNAVSAALVDEVRAQLASATPSYLSRTLAHRGEDLQRRVVVVLESGLEVTPVVLAELRSRVPVYRDQPMTRALRDSERLGRELPAARILDHRVSDADWAELARRADGEAVAFADRVLERQWQLKVLGFGDVD